MRIKFDRFPITCFWQKCIKRPDEQYLIEIFEVPKYNSTLRYECDETFSDECEFAARAEGEWCNHTCQENVFRTSIVRNFISRGVKMRSYARFACENPYFHTSYDTIRSEIKTITSFLWISFDRFSMRNFL